MHGYKRLLPIWVIGVLTVAYFNWLYFGVLAAGPLVSPDTSSYLAIDPTRTVGYFLFLKLAGGAFPDHVPQLQLNVFFLGCVALGTGLARLTRRVWLAVIIALSLAWYQGFHLYSFNVLTDSLFASLLLFVLAALALLLATGRARYALLLGGVIGLAIAVRPAGYFLLGVILAMGLVPSRFLALRSRMIVWVPIVGILGAMSTVSYLQFGSFSPQSFGGISLVGQVVPQIDRESGVRFPQLSARIQERVVPVLARRTPNADWRTFQQESGADYNELLWGNLVPEVRDFMEDTLERDREDRVLLNDLCTVLAMEAIRSDPWAYARHVGVHAYGMVKPVFRMSLYVRDHLAHAAEGSNEHLDQSPDLLTVGVSRLSVREADSGWMNMLDGVGNAPWYLMSIYRAPLLVLVGILGVSFPLLLFWARAQPEDVFVSLVALASIGYVLQMALVQVALYRYSLPAIPLLTVAGLLGAWLWLSRGFRALQQIIKSRRAKA